MDTYFEPVDTTINATVADVSIDDSNINGASTTMTYAIRQPEEYSNDFMVSLRASEIRKVRKHCMDVKISKFPCHELLLAIATTCIGCILGAITSNVKLDSLKGIIIYVICGMIASGSSVAYFFVRKKSIDDINDLANKVTEYIVDPDNL